MHGLTIATVGGRRHALRLTLPAFFAIDDLGGVLRRIASGKFTLEDVQSIWRACHQGGPVAGMEAVEAGGLAGLREAALWGAMAVSAGITSPDGKQPEGEGEEVTLGDIYQTGFAIGLKPREVDELTPWEFQQAVAGWNMVHGEQKDEAPKQDELAELFGRYGANQ